MVVGSGSSSSLGEVAARCPTLLQQSPTLLPQKFVQTRASESLDKSPRKEEEPRSRKEEDFSRPAGRADVENDDVVTSTETLERLVKKNGPCPIPDLSSEALSEFASIFGEGGDHTVATDTVATAETGLSEHDPTTATGYDKFLSTCVSFRHPAWHETCPDQPSPLPYLDLSILNDKNAGSLLLYLAMFLRDWTASSSGGRSSSDPKRGNGATEQPEQRSQGGPLKLHQDLLKKKHMEEDQPWLQRLATRKKIEEEQAAALLKERDEKLRALGGGGSAGRGGADSDSDSVDSIPDEEEPENLKKHWAKEKAAKQRKREAQEDVRGTYEKKLDTLKEEQAAEREKQGLNMDRAKIIRDNERRFVVEEVLCKNNRFLTSSRFADVFLLLFAHKVWRRRDLGEK